MIIDLAIEAGKEIMKYYETPKINLKEDLSPVTQADLKANDLIVKQIRKRYPTHGILSEELVDTPARPSNEFVWIIDPLDGTKEFIKKNGEFTVNIALTKKGRPILSVIFAPAFNELYYAELGKGAFFKKRDKITKIQVSNINSISDLRLAISRSHTSEKIKKISTKFAGVVKKGSSLKGCLIAKGDADVYFRLGNTHEWDICAMDLIIKEAGGILTDLNGEEIRYNKRNTLIKGFLVSNNMIHNELLKMIK